MKITFKKSLLVVVAALSIGSARADEGMWLLQLMKQQNSIDMMKKQGLKLEADELYNPNGVSLKDAVGIFGGGCTGEIISPEGLILTNHHCGYGAIQQHSSVEHDYLTDGFWAMNRSEELPTPGLKFRFVHRIVDITDLVNSKVKAGETDEVNAMGYPFLSKLAKEELEKSDLKGKPGIEVRALPFYAGNKFYLFYYKVYSDVRMVAAPPSSVGKFGGETDNWMWPRHTGDFSMFRIYADANGEPAEYSASNVPLKTPCLCHDYGIPRQHRTLPHPERSEATHERREPGDDRHARRAPRSVAQIYGSQRQNPHPVCQQVCRKQQLLEELHRYE